MRSAFVNEVETAGAVLAEFEVLGDATAPLKEYFTLGTEMEGGR
ncbi:MAG: hypothetical protein NT069_29630 [Planctomycetota bacterium]|nr:hypothetical protein [Planctomycetota bacterium]